jgi:hypothetical protein
MLDRMTPEMVRVRIARFDQKYASDWAIWCAAFQGSPSSEIAQLFGHILRSWQAFRGRTKGRRMRRSWVEEQKRQACHGEPYLEEVLTRVLEWIGDLGEITVRDLSNPSTVLVDKFRGVWDAAQCLVTTNDAGIVGISKAVMLLSCGRIGPAFDSTVRKQTGVKAAVTAEQWLAALQLVSRDIAVFELKHGLRIETLLPMGIPQLNVGRVYDMIAGPGNG